MVYAYLEHDVEHLQALSFNLLEATFAVSLVVAVDDVDVSTAPRCLDVGCPRGPALPQMLDRVRRGAVSGVAGDAESQVSVDYG